MDGVCSVVCMYVRSCTVCAFVIIHVCLKMRERICVLPYLQALGLGGGWCVCTVFVSACVCGCGCYL